MSRPQVVLFCGSRRWTDRDTIRRDLEGLPAGSVVVEGEAPGADRIAGQEAKRLGIHVAQVPALWDHYDKSAGYRRNEAMARLQPRVRLRIRPRRSRHRPHDPYRRSRVHPGPRALSGAVVHCMEAPYDHRAARWAAARLRA